MQAHNSGGRLSRRAFVSSVGGICASAAGLALLDGCGLPVLAPAAPRIRRVTYVSIASLAINAAVIESFRQGIRETGWVEGQTIRVDSVSADNREDRLPAIVSELAQLPVDVFLVGTKEVAVACQQASRTIPIVFANVDPIEAGLVELGLIASLARPGGQITGTTGSIVGGMSAKRLELLKAVVPSLSRVGVFWPSNETAGPIIFGQALAAAEALGLKVLSLEVRSREPEDFEAAFDTAKRNGAEALLDAGGGTPNTRRELIIDFALQMRLPLMGRTIWATLGALMAYGSNSIDNYRRAAGLVDKILRGAKPSDLPVEQPTVFEFSVNVKTAQALGITLSPDVAAQVTDWVA
jgi:putative ABC transport system substrate-binding protein